MKKLTTATATGLLSSLTLASKAFAATKVDPCPSGLKDSTICKLTGNDFGAVVGNVITTLIIIAVIIAVIFLVWGGIKWIMSGGDKAKVESARNTIIGGIIGLVLVFLAYFIISVVGNMFGVTISNLEIPNLLKK